MEEVGSDKLGSDKPESQTHTEQVHKEKTAPAIFENERILHEMLIEVEKERDSQTKIIQKISEENQVLRKQFMDVDNWSSDNYENNDHHKCNNLENNNNNGWTVENYNTVRKWQTDIEKSSYIYSEVLFDLMRKLQVTLILILILSAFAAFMNGINVALSFLDYKWVVVVFNIITLLCIGTVTVLSGTIKVLNWEFLIRILTRFVEKLDASWFYFETELSISPDQRQNAIDFIKRADGQYLYLMQESPPIRGDQYSMANRRFKERILNNHIWSRKFNQEVEERMNDLETERFNERAEEMV